MVWAAIWKGGRSRLVVMTRDEEAKRRGFTSQSYIQALEEGLLPVYDGTRHFQQDNAAIHRSAVTDTFMLNNAISLIEWPSHSPDLNPIEHVWRMLKYQLYKISPELSNLKGNIEDIAVFKECLEKAWAALDQDQIDRLLASLPRRVAACRDARGWYTHY
jgi:transposase